jgi:uncharacterized repeat protein (TIGR03837 family)
MRFKSVDIFCHVIDNFGDIGVVYRFAKEFKLRHPSCRVRVFCNDLQPLSLMQPAADASKTFQEINGIAYINSKSLDVALLRQHGPADVAIEAFGCDIPVLYQQELLQQAALWINLEYLSAETWVDGYHGKQSLLGDGTTKKYFYMPGFTKTTGGVIIDSQIEQAKPELAKNRLYHLNGILRNFHLNLSSIEHGLFGTVFTYMRGFDTLLSDMQTLDKDVYLFVFGDKSQQGMLATLQRIGAVRTNDFHVIFGNTHILMMPFLPQHEYDSLLCISDFNFVRGEDSLVRAIQAEKPFIWSAYLQDEKYHCVKVKAFLDVFQPHFDDSVVFEQYHDLLMKFNDCSEENPAQSTNEQFQGFFMNLNKFQHAAKAMSYFMTRNCNLIDKFTIFLENI